MCRNPSSYWIVPVMSPVMNDATPTLPCSGRFVAFYFFERKKKKKHGYVSHYTIHHWATVAYSHCCFFCLKGKMASSLATFPVCYSAVL